MMGGKIKYFGAKSVWVELCRERCAHRRLPELPCWIVALGVLHVGKIYIS